MNTNRMQNAECRMQSAEFRLLTFPLSRFLAFLSYGH
jgi:hypothetical protein